MGWNSNESEDRLMRRIIGFLFLACFLAFVSVQAGATIISQEDWEIPAVGTTVSNNGRELTADQWTSAKCYLASDGLGFTSFQTSTRFARSGSRSLRNENNTGKKHVEAGCSPTEQRDEKSRQSVMVGYGVNGLYDKAARHGDMMLGDEIWLGFSLYYPSDEGTNAQWWSDVSDANTMNIMQTMDSGPGFTPSVFINLRGNGQVQVQSKYSTNPTGETLRYNPSTYTTINRDRWHDFVIRHKRACDNTGILQVWVNGALITNYVNTPVALCDKQYGYMEIGQYYGTIIDNNIRVQYIDNIKVGNASSNFAEVDPSGDVDPGGENPTFITSVNGAAAITDAQYPVNFTANADGTDGFLSCLLNDKNEKPVIYNMATKVGYFKAPSLSGYTSTTATLKCLHESQLAKVAADTSWSEHGTTEAAWSGDRFGLTSGLQITKAATASSYITTGDGVDVYAAIPTWTATSSWEIEFDVIFPTSTTLPSSTVSLIDGATTSNRASIYLQDASDGLRWNTAGISSVAVDGVTVADNAYIFPKDGITRHIKATGTGTIVLANVLRKYDNSSYANSAVFNLSLKQLSTPANDSFYALNESIASAVVVDTGARAQNGTWNNRLAGDVTDQGAPAQNPAYAYKIPNTNSAFSGVASDRMALDFLYSCTSTGCDDLYFAVEDKASGAHRLTAVGSAGSLTLATENGGFGTATSVKNWVVDATAGVHKARVNFKIGTEGYNNIYNFYAGSKDASVGHTFVLHDVIPHKNYTTAAVTHPITLTLTDADNPDLSDCTMPVVLDPQSGTYTATVTCTTTEIGGDYFVMLRDTNAAPADSDVVIAGTGALRSATGPVDSLTISAEFSGLAYQDLWAYVVHRDAATNKSTPPASATFDDGVGIGQKKKFKWSIAGGNKIECFDSNLNLLVPFTGNMEVSITDGDYFEEGNLVTELAYAATIPFVSGEAEFDDSDASVLDSINSLLTGEQGYNFWATDGTCRADDAIQLIVE